MIKKKSPAALGNVLKKIISTGNLQYRINVNRVFLFWDEIVSPEIANFARPQAVKGDVLWLRVSDSVWMHQLHYQKIEIMELVNRKLSDDFRAAGCAGKMPQICDIRFEVGMIPTTVPGPKNEPKKLEEAAVDPERQQRFETLIKSIKDEELRERMRRIWLNQEKRLD